MNHSMIAAAIAVLSLAACDKPTVVNVPPSTTTTTPTPGPAGPQGTPGTPGTGTTVIVTPPASAASN